MRNWVAIFSLISMNSAFGDQVYREPVDLLNEAEVSSKSSLSKEEVPEDFIEINMRVANEIRSRTGATLMDVPYSIQWSKKDARVTIRNPKTGNVETFRVERIGSSCC